MHTDAKIHLDTIAEAIVDIQKGKMIIVADDENRENEGDFICAAAHATPEIVNFMVKHGSGVLCTPLTEERCKVLSLAPMVSQNTAVFKTAFTVSVDLIGQGCTTGISAQDRAKTIRALVDPQTKPENLGRPGHIFPLTAKSGGVLRRAGHTEAAVDFTKLAQLIPGGLLAEVTNPDGSMARLPQLRKIADQFNLKLVTIKDLIQYRLQHETLIKKKIEVSLPTAHGNFQLHAYEQTNTQEIHLALVKGCWQSDEEVLVRVHSSCATGDILGSLKCDCGQQLQKAMQMVEKKGKGVILYMKQEGRGIGLLNKLKAYQLQAQGMDTVEANLALGFKMDERDYGIGAQILRDLNIKNIQLISNNPTKRAGLHGYNLRITKTIPLHIKPNPHNTHYLATKRDKMQHCMV